MTRDFHITDILSITSDTLVSTRHVAGLYDILDFMTGRDTHTHEIPREITRCGPELLRQHPQLKDADCEGVNEGNHAERVALWVAQFGETLPVTSLS